MERKWKITLGLLISLIIVIGGVAGGLLLNNYLRNNDSSDFNNDPPILAFPVANTEVLAALYGFIWNETHQIHNGIDFMINDTANIVAPCNMTVNDKSLFYNELGDHWQAGLSFDINDDYELLIAFESFAQNETFGNLQLDAIIVDIGQEVTQGQLLGQLFLHRNGAHIHFMLHKNHEPVCPYLYFSSAGKVIFDTLWSQFGLISNPCNGTLSF
ncbi:MAG: M23 family metallopeptidase [Candidatus Heimdallarchaeota archaeon]